jgi:hypothetical protein
MSVAPSQAQPEIPEFYRIFSTIADGGIARIDLYQDSFQLIFGKSWKIEKKMDRLTYVKVPRANSQHYVCVRC